MKTATENMHVGAARNALETTVVLQGAISHLDRYFGPRQPLNQKAVVAVVVVVVVADVNVRQNDIIYRRVLWMGRSRARA